MNKKYWDEVSLKHDEKIFDVFSNDKQEVIQNAIRQHSSKDKTVMDLGCAIGNWLPLLSSNFKRVYAVDIAKTYIEKAKKRNARFNNIEYIHQDLVKGSNKLPVSDFVVCINTLLTPNKNDRDLTYNTIIKLVRKGGHLVLVVPALESALFSEYMLDQWDARDKKAGKKVSSPKQKAGNPFNGTILLDGTPTKHHLKEELQFMLLQSGFDVLQTSKVEYTWKTEFHNPPAWMKAPYPWDWLVVAQKK